MKDEYESGLFIHVFKTNIRCREDIIKLKPLLDAQIGTSRWSVDISDVDLVLRTECQHNDNQRIIKMVTHAGYHCEELID